jgi:hypothetical protein
MTIVPPMESTAIPTIRRGIKVKNAVRCTVLFDNTKEYMQIENKILITPLWVRWLVLRTYFFIEY